MNIQQLNGSGQKLWVFFVTAVLALLVTGGSWIFFNRVAPHKDKAVAWYKERVADKRAHDESQEAQRYGLLIRMAMLVWLVRNGYASWMWKSGAWMAITTNSKALARGHFLTRECSAFEYVSIFSEIYRSEDVFTTRPELMVKWPQPWG